MNQSDLKANTQNCDKEKQQVSAVTFFLMLKIFFLLSRKLIYDY